MMKYGDNRTGARIRGKRARSFWTGAMLMLGLLAASDCVRAADAPVGETLLSQVADSGADLLVMGGYGHSRWRELVMGGATRTILKSMTVPVLMSH